jgi:hypothetical protein
MNISEASLQIPARQKNIHKVKLGDICSITFSKNQSDTVWSLRAVEHYSIPDKGKALSVVGRVLKHGANFTHLWPSVRELVNAFLWWLFPTMPSQPNLCPQGTKVLKQNDFLPCGSITTIMGDIIHVGRKV